MALSSQVSISLRSEPSGSLPPEIVDIILDQLGREHDFASLRSCSLVCRSWSARSSFHLFHSLSVTSESLSPEQAARVRDLVSSSRISSNVKHLTIPPLSAMSETLPVMLRHLPHLETLKLDMCQDPNDILRLPLPSSGRNIKSVEAVWLDLDVVACFLSLFTSVDVLHVYANAQQMRVPQHTCAVKRLEVYAGPHSLSNFHHLVNPASLSSVVLYAFKTSPMFPSELDDFLHSVGREIRHFEYFHAGRGWTVEPENIPGLTACRQLRSVVVAAPPCRTHPSNAAYWEDILVVLRSLPVKIESVRLVTPIEGQADSGAISGFLCSLDWRAVSQALQHCDALRRLAISVLDEEYRPVLLVGSQWKATVLEHLSPRLRDVTSFELYDPLHSGPQ